MLQPLGSRFRAHLGYTGHVVNHIAHQGLKIHHQVRRHAKLGLHASQVAALAVHGVNDGDVAVDQLGQVFVAAAHNHLYALPRGNHRECADHVVRLHTGHVQHLPAHQAHHLMDGFDLGTQVVGHRRAMGLVLGVQVVPKGGAFGIKNTSRVVGGHLLAQALQHIDHAANSPRGRAGRVAGHGTQIRHGVKRPVKVAGTVYQQ